MVRIAIEQHLITTTKTESIIDVRPCEEGRVLINDTGRNKPSLLERRPENQFFPLLELVGRDYLI